MIKTSHNLLFEVAKSPYAILGSNHKLFRVGSCEGQWDSTHDCYVIISVFNKTPGNGHFDDVLEWFENSCRRDNKNLLVVECLNKDFYRHLLLKRGFTALDSDRKNCIKIFNKKAYKKMLKKGNELLLAESLQCR